MAGGLPRGRFARTPRFLYPIPGAGTKPMEGAKRNSQAGAATRRTAFRKSAAHRFTRNQHEHLRPVRLLGFVHLDSRVLVLATFTRRSWVESGENYNLLFGS